MIWTYELMIKAKPCPLQQEEILKGRNQEELVWKYQIFSFVTDMTFGRAFVGRGNSPVPVGVQKSYCSSLERQT